MFLSDIRSCCHVDYHVSMGTLEGTIAGAAAGGLVGNDIARIALTTSSWISGIEIEEDLARHGILAGSVIGAMAGGNIGNCIFDDYVEDDKPHKGKS